MQCPGSTRFAQNRLRILYMIIATITRPQSTDREHTAIFLLFVTDSLVYPPSRLCVLLDGSANITTSGTLCTFEEAILDDEN